MFDKFKESSISGQLYTKINGGLTCTEEEGGGCDLKTVDADCNVVVWACDCDCDSQYG